MPSKSVRSRKGGSNAGKYKKGPFCGKAGGAPEGTFPVDTRKRAIAAIAYSGNAPDPEGVRKCVYKHYPDLKKKKEQMSDEEFEAFFAEEMEKDIVIDLSDDLTIKFEETEVDSEVKRTASMLAYTGQRVNHWFFGDVIIDMETLTLAQDTIPILYGHETDKIVGFASDIEIEEGKGVYINDIQILSNPIADTFVQNSKQGFPYQASVGLGRADREYIPEDGEVEVNGYSLKGPLTVMRNAELRESSVCVFGVDGDTDSVAYSDEEGTYANTTIPQDYQVNHIPDKEEQNMPFDPKTFSEDTEFQKFTEQVKKEAAEEAKAQFESEMKAKDAELSAKDETIAKLSKDSESMNSRLVELEKKEAIRQEKAILAEANEMVSVKCAAIGLPERLFSKVRANVDHNKFVEEGKLNREKFAEVIDKELEDWKDVVLSNESIMGGGSIDHDHGSSFSDEEDKKHVQYLARLAGYGSEQKKTN